WRLVESRVHERARRLRRQDAIAARPRVGGIAVKKVDAAADTVSVIAGSRLCDGRERKRGEGECCDRQDVQSHVLLHLTYDEWGGRGRPPVPSRASSFRADCPGGYRKRTSC